MLSKEARDHIQLSVSCCEGIADAYCRDLLDDVYELRGLLADMVGGRDEQVDSAMAKALEILDD